MSEPLPTATGIHKHPTRKLGKAPRRIDPRTLKMARYMNLAALPPAPASCNLLSKVTNFGSMLNDDIGDCTIAGAGHMVQCWTAEAGKQVIIPDAEIQAAYTEITGYNPADPNTDTGAVEIDVLNYWRTTGIGGHKIGAYAALPLSDPEYLKQSIYLLGGAYAGFDLPTYVENAKSWLAPTVIEKIRNQTTPGSWGGHAVPFVAYDEKYIYIVSWGIIVPVAWAFVFGSTPYCDELYGILSADQLCDSGLTPAGLNNAQIEKDLHLIAA